MVPGSLLFMSTLGNLHTLTVSSIKLPTCGRKSSYSMSVLYLSACCRCIIYRGHTCLTDCYCASNVMYTMTGDSQRSSVKGQNKRRSWKTSRVSVSGDWEYFFSFDMPPFSPAFVNELSYHYVSSMTWASSYDNRIPLYLTHTWRAVTLWAIKSRTCCVWWTCAVIVNLTPPRNRWPLGSDL